MGEGDGGGDEGMGEEGIFDVLDGHIWVMSLC